MAFIDQWDLSEETEFQKKIEVAIAKSAIAVQAEDPASLSLPAGFVGSNQDLHNARSILAADILADPARWKINFARGVVSNSSITPASGDNDIEFQVNAQWNAYAVNYYRMGSSV